MSTKCITPFHVRKGLTTHEKIPVPCGKCPPCLKRRTSGWSFRLMREGDVSDTALFVTLTYDTEYVPITENGYKNLSKHDVQKFFKRLRKIEQNKLKYFAVGEYGSKRMRPHYHIILYNANANNVHRAWALDGKMLGQIYIGSVSGASIGYTLKYMQKESKVPIHKNDDRQKEFQLMSKGLGKSYLTDRMIKWHKSDLEKRMYVPIIDGRKIPMPRYYKDKIYKESEKNRIARYIAKISEEQLEEEMNKYGVAYHYEMSQKHINAFRKMYKNSKQIEKLDI
jgi:hypothetical protein